MVLLTRTPLANPVLPGISIARPNYVLCFPRSFEGAYAEQAEPAQGHLHGDSHVCGSASGVGALVHPQLACGDRCQVSNLVARRVIVLSICR